MRNSSLFPRLRRAKASAGLRRRTLQAERLESRELLAADPIVTVDTNFGNFQIELLPGAAPQTVANFLSYVDSGAYTNSIFHRSVPGFVEESGGFTSASDTFSGSTSQFTTIPTHAPIPLEYNLPNALGTVGMARTSALDSATDEWFVNMVDNSQTLNQGNGGGYAVFGKILGNGMQVLTTIAGLPVHQADNNSFSQLPLGPNNQLVRISSISVDSIDGTVFNDANGNGQFDSGEAGVAGRTVFIDSNGTGIAGGTNPTTTTDAQGNYSFTGLAPGTYTVREVAPSGVRSSEPLQTVTVSADHTASGVNFGESRIPMTFHVDSKLSLVLDRDSSGGLSAGDEVTFGQGQSYEQDNLTYDAAPTGGDTGTAFSSISQALASPLVQAGDTIDIAGGTYSEFGITINKDLTLEGLGKVVINAAQPQPFQSILFPPGGASLASANVIYPGSVGISIVNHPNQVTLANLDIEGFDSSLHCDGCGTLTLSDLTLHSLPLIEARPFTPSPMLSISNVADLNLVSTADSPQKVVIASQQGFISSYDSVSISALGDVLGINAVSRLSVTTGAGADSFYIAPLLGTTITLNGGDPTMPADPGDALEINFSGTTGAQLATSADSSGSFGSWTFANRQPIVFKNFETLLPASTSSQGDLTINTTEGADRRNLVVARFVDPNGAGPVSYYSAEISWGDGSDAIPATVSFDPASNQFTVTDNADIGRYSEDGTYTVVVTVHRSGHPDIILTAKAIVAEPSIEGTGLTIIGSAGVPLAGSHGLSAAEVAQFVHGGNQETFMNFGDGDPNNPARIDWGDGTTTTGMISSPGGTSETHYSVFGAHTYSKPGHYIIKATVLDDGNQTVIVSTADIGDPFLPPGEQGTPNERFIAAVYGELLNRQIDSDGLKYWAAKLDADASRREVVAGIQNSDEYRHDEINALFQTYLHRDADQGALDADNKLLLQGETLEQLAAMIVNSQEYFQQHGGGTNDGFLAALFQDALDRQIDDGAKASFEQELSHGVTRAQIADHVFGSKEYRSVEVQSLYQQALDRDADQAGVAYWTDKLADGLRDEQVLAAIMGSQEYFDKTQQ